MGFITFVMLCGFSLLSLASFVPKSFAPAFRALDFIRQHIRYIAFGGVGYGILAMIFASFISGPDMLIRLLANTVLILMALPYAFESAVAEWGPQLNPAILKEAGSMIGVISRWQKLMGILGAFSALLLFSTVF